MWGGATHACPQLISCDGHYSLTFWEALSLVPGQPSGAGRLGDGGCSLPAGSVDLLGGMTAVREPRMICAAAAMHQSEVIRAMRGPAVAPSRSAPGTRLSVDHATHNA